MAQFIVKNYSFDASAKQITFTDMSSVMLEGLQLITNVTTNTLIYQFNDSSKGGTLSGNVLTLDFDTTSMSDTDNIQIIYNEPSVSDLQRDIKELNDAVLAFVQFIYANSPRLDQAGRQAVSVESGTVSISGTISALTTITNVQALSNLVAIAGLTPAHSMQDVPLHIYDQISVS